MALCKAVDCNNTNLNSKEKSFVFLPTEEKIEDILAWSNQYKRNTYKKGVHLL